MYLFSRQQCRISQRLTDVFRLEIGVILYYFVGRDAICHEIHHMSNRYPHSANTGPPNPANKATREYDGVGCDYRFLMASGRRSWAVILRRSAQPMTN